MLHALLPVLADTDRFPARNRNNPQLTLMGFSYPTFLSLN